MPWVNEKTGKGQDRGKEGQEQNRRQPFWWQLPRRAGDGDRHGVVRIQPESPDGKRNACGVQTEGGHNPSEAEQPLTANRGNDRDHGPIDVCAHRCGGSEAGGGLFQPVRVFGDRRPIKPRGLSQPDCEEGRNRRPRNALRFDAVRVGSVPPAAAVRRVAASLWFRPLLQVFESERCPARMAEPGPLDALFAALGAERPIGQALSAGSAKIRGRAAELPARRAFFLLARFFRVQHGPVTSVRLFLRSQLESPREMIYDVERLRPEIHAAFASRIHLHCSVEGDGRQPDQEKQDCSVPYSCVEQRL